MKILILDPDWRFAQEARDYLESHAHMVVHQTSDQYAQDKLESWKPDLVMVSAELCENSDLSEKINNTDSAVLLTGWMDKYDMVWRMWQKTGHELFMKPVFDMDELYQSMVVALENAASGEERIRHAASA